MRVLPTPTVDCPVCDRPAGLCCVNKIGAARRNGQHPERITLTERNTP